MSTLQPPRTGGPSIGIGVDSEVGRLREVIVHRPGMELDPLTPANAAELLFDDVLWPSTARVLHRLMADSEPSLLADVLIGGVLKSDLSPLSSASVTWESLGIDDFLLPRLPNTQATQNSASSFSAGDGVSTI